MLSWISNTILDSKIIFYKTRFQLVKFKIKVKKILKKQLFLYLNLILTRVR